MDTINQPNYTIKAAATRTGKSTRTIERWIASGMHCREVAGVIVIDHTTLLATLRAKLAANPNRKTRSDGSHDVGDTR
jgi:hypothetical protein